MNSGRGSNGITWTNTKLEKYLYLEIHKEGKNGRDYIPKSVIPTLVRKKRKYAAISNNVKNFSFN